MGKRKWRGASRRAVSTGILVYIADPEADETSYACLRFMDPYGDTTFNQLQMPHLLEDLERLLPRCPTPETRQHVEAMMDLTRKAAGEVHTYIKFYGD